MKKLRFVFVMLALLLYGSMSAQDQNALKQLMQERGEYYFTLNMEDALRFPNLGELCSVDGSDGKIVVCYANQEEYDKLLTLGLHPDLQTPPSLREEARMWDGNRATYEWNSYLTYDQYVSMMQGFPSTALSDRTCTLIDLGQLSTSNHRHLYGVRIYKGEPYGKPKFLYSSTMHGDEVTGMILMLRLIDELCTSTDSRIVNLLNDVDIYIFPCNNPDGTYAGGNNTVNGATRANGNSVDLNRNYKDYFNGDHPDGYSSYQNETQWTMAQADQLLFTMAANYHGGAEVMNYCWDWVFQDHADMDWWEYVCAEYVQRARQVSSSYMGGYNYGSNNYDYDGVTNGATWYSITGSRQDYMNGYGQCREVTVECSTTKTPSASQLPNFWNYNHNSMLALMEQARNGVHGVVYDASTGQTIQDVTVSVLNHDISNSYVTTHEVGDFHRPIKGGSYTFIFDKDGYARKFVKVTVADGQRVDLMVNLTPSSATKTECYEQVAAANMVAGPYLMGYLNGSTLVMPTHDNRNTTTSVSVSTTSLSVTPTDDGFTLPLDLDRQRIAIEPSGTSGQYHIVYKGRMLQRSNSSLVWAKPSNSSGNGVSLSPYNWHIDATGVYYQSGSTKYYLNYSNGSFTTSTTNSNNISFYRERECPPAGYSVQASYDHLNGSVTFSIEGHSGTELTGLEGGETITMSVSANEGYAFNSITATDSDNNPVNLTLNGDGTYWFTMPEADVTVSVVFDATDYTVSVANDILHGTVLVNDSESLCDAHAGQTISVTATPDPGFILNTLYYIAEGTTTEIAITGNCFTMPTSNLTVYAVFVKDCGGGEVTYERVTEAPDDWSGTYLLVYQNSTTATSGYAFNGTMTSGNANSTTININGGTTINELGGAAELVIEKVASSSNYFYIKHGSNYWYADGTNLYEGTSASGNTYQWSLTMNSNIVNIHTASVNYPIYFNSNSSGSYPHQFYPSSQNAANVYLYRKSVSSSGAMVSFSPVSGTALSAGNRTVTLTSSIEGLPIYYTIDGTEPTMNSDHAISPVTLRFNDAVTVKAFVYDDPENEGCGIGATATATYTWFTPGNCYHLETSVSEGSYVMGYLDSDGALLHALTYSNNSNNPVAAATEEVTITDYGFSSETGTTIPQVTLTATQSNGQYNITYKSGNYTYYLGRSYQGNLTWNTQQRAWNINNNGIYTTQNNVTYHLYYDTSSSSFKLSTSQTTTNNITFYAEGNCPQVSPYTITATADPAEGGSIEGANLYYQGETCTMTATANEGYTFVNWTENDVEVSTDANYSFEVTAERELVAHFEADVPVVGQTVTLSKGWNWWSTNLDITLEQLETALDGYGVMIKSQTEYATYGSTGWDNSDMTSDIDVRQLYKIRVNANCEFTLPGTPVNPADYPITLYKGYNWIGYPCSQSIALSEAFGSDFTPTTGDMIKSQNGYAIYNGTTWECDELDSFEPGKGYIYKSNATETKTFTFAVPAEE